MMSDDDKLYQALVDTKRKLEKLQTEKQVLQGRQFEAWYDQRKVTISTIEELQQKINTLCVGANVARGVGAVAGLASVFAGIVGFVLEAKGHQETAENFNQFGKLCGGAGIAVVAGSSLLELGLSRSFMNEIESVLQKDMELTKPLRNWVDFSRKADLLFEEHFQCSITSSIMPKVMEVVGYCIEALDEGHAEFQHLMRDLQSCKLKNFEEIPEEVTQIVMRFLKRIYNNRKLLAPLRCIWKIFKETPYTFEFAKLGCIMYCSVYKALNASRLSCLLSLAGIPCPDIGPNIVRFAFDAVTIGFNVVTIILAAQNIMEGKSKYSDALDDITKALRHELEQVLGHMDKRCQHLGVKYEDILGLRNLKLR